MKTVHIIQIIWGVAVLIQLGGIFELKRAIRTHENAAKMLIEARDKLEKILRR
jgi:hypothetical protein